MIPVYIGYCAVFKVREEARTHDLQRRPRGQSAAGDAPVSQNSTACGHSADKSWRSNGMPFPDSVDISSPDALPALVNSRFSLSAGLARRDCLTGSGCPLRDFPRKEVIQPQLPLRLPCYDFTPVTSPTFDGSLPCGLGHRLRVLLTPMV